MTRDRLVDLARIECKLARKINFDDVVKTYDAKKARKAFLNKCKRQFLHFVVTFIFDRIGGRGPENSLVPSTFNHLGGPGRVAKCCVKSLVGSVSKYRSALK